MPQEPKNSPVLPNVAKHRLKSPAPSLSQLHANGSDGKQSEEGSVLSSDEEEVCTPAGIVAIKAS